MATGKPGVFLAGERTLQFGFPSLGEDEGLEVRFHRMLRVEDGDTINPLPSPIGCFPLHLVDDHAARLPDAISKRGGIMFPVQPFEAMQISITVMGDLPFAVKIGAGKINVISGNAWSDDGTPAQSDIVFVRNQVLLDGFYVDRGLVRQFVAAPLGQGLTVEEQLTGEYEFAGLQLAAYPLRAEIVKLLKEERERAIAAARAAYVDGVREMRALPSQEERAGIMPGGYLAQDFQQSRFKPTSWDVDGRVRCFVQPILSSEWQRLTEMVPPLIDIYARPEVIRHHPKLANYRNLHVASEAWPILSKLRSIAWFKKNKRIDPPIYNEVINEGAPSVAVRSKQTNWPSLH